MLLRKAIISALLSMCIANHFDVCVMSSVLKKLTHCFLEVVLSSFLHPSLKWLSSPVITLHSKDLLSRITISPHIHIQFSTNTFKYVTDIKVVNIEK